MKTIYAVWLMRITVEYESSLVGLFKSWIKAKHFVKEKEKQYPNTTHTIIEIKTDLFESEQQ